MVLKICTVAHIFNFLHERGKLGLGYKENTDIHVCAMIALGRTDGVALARGCHLSKSCGGRKKSQLLFGFRDQSLVCKHVCQPCSAEGGQPQELSMKFQIWDFMLVVVGLGVFVSLFFLAWFGREKQGTSLVSEVDSMQICW